ncbi:hypothetical protein KBA63_04040 [Candidatus Woesebacteria bacterium]|jgi:hypothetical protein|nr:hypothetical protein [Candidatus Woesebacteria bacterium]MBP9687679.1 hypothetical protein [Candidatus Woesebacteria bacterium]
MKKVPPSRNNIELESKLKKANKKIVDTRVGITPQERASAERTSTRQNTTTRKKTSQANAITPI